MASDDTPGSSGRPSRPRRPAFLGPAALGSLPGGPDPAKLAEAAHATATALVDAGRSSSDRDTTDRLVRLVDEHGIDAVADLWADRPARSLPGALWRLYALREAVRRDTAGAVTDFVAGRHLAPVPRVIAGAVEPPTPEGVLHLADAILSGIFDGDLAVALERAGAFCRVLAAGRAVRADDLDALEPEQATAVTRSSAMLQRTAEDLEAAAALWRSGGLV
jgi:hypothetical protein